MADKSGRRLLLCGVISIALARTAVEAQVEFISRTFNGTANNIDNPEWGSIGTTQIRSVVGDHYADGVSTPPGDDRPTAREVMTDVFLSSTADVSKKSALFVAWGQLLTYDMSLTIDNSSEPFNIACDDGGGVVDVWCPKGAASDEIPFYRSNAAVSNSVRNPINYATSYIDLDFMYGRSEEEARTLRTFDGGFMNVTEKGLPFRNPDGTWMMPDQRTARFPVTFALHIMLLIEHNRCCVEVAPAKGFEEDEEIYLACRGWTIAIFQHMTADDYTIRLLGGTIYVLGVDSTTSSTSGSSSSSSGSSSNPGDGTSERRRERRLVESRSQTVGATIDGKRELMQETGLDGVNDVHRPPLRRPEYIVEGRRSGASLRAGGEFEASTTSTPSNVLTPAYVPRRRLYSPDVYDADVTAAADVFALTAGAAAFESAIPPTVRIVSEGYVSVREDNIELAAACEDIAGLFERNEVANILRGAVLSPALEIDTYYATATANGSPLFKLPVDAVQRGRDHGLPTYVEAREAFGLAPVSNFSEITSDARLASLLSEAYGGDINNLDAITGGLAESTGASTGGVFGDLLHEAWVDQFFRAIAGDRLYHVHGRPMEAVDNTTLSDVVSRTMNISDLPLSVFVVPSVTVCAADCEVVGDGAVTLSDSYAIAWEILDEDTLSITLKAKDIGEAGMLAIGWGGLKMSEAQDYVICVVSSATEGECIDRSPVSTHTEPSPDQVDPYVNVTGVSIEGEWTTITFLRDLSSLDDEDYDLKQDLDTEAETMVIYSYREGAGVGQHPNANRGASTVNFATGDAETKCDEDDQFLSLHGSLMLLAWMFLAPAGIYYIRYCKGQTVEWAGREWFEMHEEIMIVASEAVLPLGITAVFASGGTHTTSHAYWGFYMIAAVAAQVFTGWIRKKGLQAKHANFSLLHRFNKYFHIWAGRIAYFSGVIQCYRGLELVSGQDELMFSAVEGFDLQLGHFSMVTDYVFPGWLGLISVGFIFCECRKQYRRFFSKGSAHICACVDVINEEYDGFGSTRKHKLMPRTEDLDIYTAEEFNEKVLNGQNWVLVDGAILDVTSFIPRHPGGARLIRNAVGTDITQELLGQDMSVGHAMSFTPHVHRQNAWDIVRSLVVGYIDDDDDDDDIDNVGDGKEQEDEDNTDDAGGERGPGLNNRQFSMSGKDRSSRFAFRPVVLSGAKLNQFRDTVAIKSTRLNNLVSIPIDQSQSGEGAERTDGKSVAAAPPSLTLPDTTDRRKLKRSGPSNKQLNRFFVCPLLFREKMEPSSGVGRGKPPSKRPVYRYIFSCPGQAHHLVDAINGVCYLNMRAQEAGKGVIQRSYNAYAVRVQDMSAPASSRGVKGGGGTGAGTRMVVPAGQTTEGTLCIEMRIRLLTDGAMSKLLENLANDTDNPAVQLQGPFVNQALCPPPAHRNVIMIAAGTGVNPMVQQIRDYMALPRDGTNKSRSRLALVWQSTSEAELYGTDEITEMQARSNGLLEVTVLISGFNRKRNVPGAAFSNAKKMMANARNLISPAVSTASSCVLSLPDDREEQQTPPIGTCDVIEEEGSDQGEEEGPRLDTGDRPKQQQGGDDAAATPAEKAVRAWPQARKLLGLRKELARKPSRRTLQPKGTYQANALKSMASDSVGGLLQGKVNREVLDGVFGTALLGALKANHKDEEEKEEGGSTGENSKGGGATDASDDETDVIAGSDVVAGKLQVVVSGPTGFVFHVENLLTEMGVPSKAIVLLD